MLFQAQQSCCYGNHWEALGGRNFRRIRNFILTRVRIFCLRPLSNWFLEKKIVTPYGEEFKRTLYHYHF